MDLTTTSQEGKTMTHTPARIAREDQAAADLELSMVARAQRADHRLRRILTAALIVGATLVGLLWAPPWAPRPAHAAGTGPRVDVCVLKADLGKSWTRGLEKAANREYRQPVNVKRVSEDQLGGCEVVVWAGGKVALDYITGEPAPNPRYHVYTGEYAMVDAEINVGTSTPRKERKATLLQALRESGVIR